MRTFILAALLVGGLLYIGGKINLIPSWDDLFRPKPVVVDQTPIIVQQVRNIAQLMTIETWSEIVADSAKIPERSLFGNILRHSPYIPIGSLQTDKLVLIVKGKVIAGLDLSRLDANAIRVKEDTVSLRLPRARILDVLINPSDVEVFSEKGKWEPAAITRVQQAARNTIVQNALNQQVLRRAEEKGSALISDLMRNSGYKEVRITWER